MEWTVAKEEDGTALSGFLRAHVPGKSWNDLKRFIASGKVFVGGARELSSARRLGVGETVELRMAAPRPRDPRKEVRILHEDEHVVVIDKPSGVSSVPYEKREQGTAMDLIRDAWRRMGKRATNTPLLVVHRIDKETSGLLVYAKSKRAEKELGGQFRAHTVERIYLVVAHGRVVSQRIESQLVADRGDGLRGSTRHAGQGKRAVTHVAAVRPLAGATLCEVRLETGKTHQIRIHLSEKGHPIVGEKVYVRDYAGAQLPSARLLLHAMTLGFRHPVTGEALAFRAEPPEDFSAEVARLSRS